MSKHNVVIDGVTYIPAPEQPAESTLTAHERRILKVRVNGEGLHYAMTQYSHYTHGQNQIDDRRFHQLREAFVQANQELDDFFHEQGIYDE